MNHNFITNNASNLFKIFTLLQSPIIVFAVVMKFVYKCINSTNWKVFDIFCFHYSIKNIFSTNLHFIFFNECSKCNRCFSTQKSQA